MTDAPDPGAAAAPTDLADLARDRADAGGAPSAASADFSGEGERTDPGAPGPIAPPEAGDALTHFDERGAARMVDVGAKGESARAAVATGAVEMAAATLARVRDGEIGKGDVLGVARVAAIGGVKRAAELIPLCHPLRVTGVDVEFTIDEPRRRVAIRATVRAFDRTGVEMEALTAVTVAALTIYDMCKAIDRAMRIVDVQLEEKRGGKSGHWRR